MSSSKQGPGLSFDTPDGSKTLQFQNHYIQHDKIAKGSFGTVFVATHQGTNEDYAVKVIDKERLSAKETDSVMREVSILADCRDVEYIVRLVDFYESPTHFYVVQVYAQGGDVFGRLATLSNYSEREARDLAVHLLKAMEVLHSRNVAHRDLKPENLLLRDLLHDSEILVADFGFASHVPERGLQTRCGTPAFVAPEILVQDCHYDERVDMWSVGCLLYMLLGGYPPFQDRTHRGLFRKIRGADFCFHDAYWKNVSVSAKQLIASLLTVEPEYRCSAKLALEKAHWLKINATRLSAKDLGASLSEIKKFHARRKIKGAMHAVLWSVRAKFRSSDSGSFRNQMRQWDKEENQNDCAQEEPEESITVSMKNLLVPSKFKPDLSFLEAYDMGAEIHNGSSTSIHECVHRESKMEYAVKVIPRTKKTPDEKTRADTILQEVAVMSKFHHRNLLQIVDFFEEDDAFYLVMERMRGGDLFDRIMVTKRYTEKDAHDLALYLLRAIQHMHSHGIAHRDLKPQNILLSNPSGDDHQNYADLKIGDFGFACRVHTPQSLTTRCGTPSYVAPEILKNVPYDQSADMWSVGCIMYVLLSGTLPFADDNQSQLFQKIRMGEWTFKENIWDSVSDGAKELIQNLLVVNPTRRWTADQALLCSWLNDDDSTLDAKDLSQSQDGLKRRKSRFVAIAKTVMHLAVKKSAVETVEELISRKEDIDDESSNHGCSDS